MGVHGSSVVAQGLSPRLPRRPRVQVKREDGVEGPVIFSGPSRAVWLVGSGRGVVGGLLQCHSWW